MSKTKDRDFSTVKLAESIEALREACGVKVQDLYTATQLSKHSYYSALNSKQMA